MNSRLQFSLPLSLSVCLLTNSFQAKPIAAQVTTDNTTGTTVDVDGNNFIIRDGTQNSGNLFHSFQDFSVPNGGEAFFDNALDVTNILSRVTGGNPSDINGTIRANGNANLFFINPAGIIFGENARLNIGGSFYGSTADSILFEDGTFSAVNNLDAPILTINAPIGLGFRDNPSSIVNNSIADDTSSLSVLPGATFALLGGDINFTEGVINAPGANIELGGLLSSGTIILAENFKPSFPENIARANISFSDAARINVTGDNGGSITLNANNIEFTGASELLGGIAENSGNAEALAGNISLNAIGLVNFDGESNIENRVNEGSTGNSGDINVNALSLSLTGGGYFSASTFGTGDAGNINVDVVGAVELSGTTENSLTRFASVISEGAVGDGGDINITADSVSLTNGALLNTTVSSATDGISGGIGDAGNVFINVNGNTELVNSNIFSQVGEDGLGEGGTITLNTANLSLLDGSQISAGVFGTGNAGVVTINASDTITFQGIDENGFASGIVNNVDLNGVGNAGNIDVTATNLNLIDGGTISSNVFGEGNAGEITVNASNAITLDGFTDFDENTTTTRFSSIESRTFSNAEGTNNAGDISITAGSLSLSDRASLSSSTSGNGSAGNLLISVNGNTELVDSDIFSQVGEGGVGEGGTITLNTANLSLLDGSQISAGVFGTGNAGVVTINASDTITFQGIDETGFSSGILSDVDSGGVGNAGNIDVTATNLNLINGGTISSNVFGEGNGGEIKINASNAITLDGFTVFDENTTTTRFSSIETNIFDSAEGIGGTISIQAQNLFLRNGSEIIAITLGQGQAGNIDVNATDSVSISGVATFPRLSDGNPGGFSSGLIASTEANAGGIGGEIVVTTPKLEIAEGGVISARSRGGFEGGNITINTDILNLNSGGQILTTAFAGGNSGNINLNIGSRLIVEGEDSTFESRFNSVRDEFGLEQANFTIDTINQFSGIFANTSEGSTGNGGNITIGVFQLENNQPVLGSNPFTQEITIADGGTIAADSAGTGNGGTVTIFAQNLALENQGQVLAETNSSQPEGTVPSEITLSIADNLFLRENSIISAASNSSDGGNITINAANGFVIAFPNDNEGDGNDISARSEGGTGGNIFIEAKGVLGLREGDITPGNNANDIDATGNLDDGNVEIITPNADAIQGANQLPSTPVEPGETIFQACSAQRGIAGNNFVIMGKGGIPREPSDVLQSESITVNDEAKKAESNVKEYVDPILTSQGEIIPAQGVEITENGDVILTAYRTEISSRNLSTSVNCGKH